MCRTKIISLTYPKTSDSVKLSSYLAEIKNWMYKDVLLLNNNSLYFLKQIKLVIIIIMSVQEDARQCFPSHHVSVK